MLFPAEWRLCRSARSREKKESELIPTLETLRAAAARAKPHIHRTPLLRSKTLSAMTGLDVHLKAELLQKTGSFKPRGFINKLMTLPQEQQDRGAITFSAGNAAQGLAFAAAIVGMNAVVVMPASASPAKAEATHGYGAEVILHGDVPASYAYCMELAERHGYTFVSGFDDVDAMQGHASLGLELLEDLPALDAVIVPVGGGGLIGGIAMGLRASGSKARIFGIEPAGADAMRQSLAAGKPMRIQPAATIADGLAAPFAGERCFPIARDHVEAVVTVPDTAIAEAIKLLLARTKLLTEGAGAASVAGLLHGKLPLKPGSTVVCVLSGGNIDAARLKALL